MGRRGLLLAAALLSTSALAQIIIFDVPDPLELVHLDAGSVYTDYVQTRRIDAGTVYAGYLEADSASIDVLSVGVLDAGTAIASIVHAGQVDAGFMRSDVLHFGTVDAGIAWLQQARNPDGGRLYAPTGLVVDQGFSVGFRGPTGDSLIHHTGGALTLNAGAGLKVGTVDGFFTQTEATLGQLSPNALQISGGTTATQMAVVGGTVGPSADAGIDIVPVGQGTVRVWGDGVRTPQIGNADGGFLLFSSLGVKPTVITEVPFCDGVNVPFGALMFYFAQWWECSIALASFGWSGGWSYMGQPPITATARTPGDPAGVSTAAGIAFNSVNPGTHYTQFIDLTATVEFAGSCGGGCTAGTVAQYLVVQRNRQDGGYRELAMQQIPCTAARGFCSMTSAPASTGCASDGGIFLRALPADMGGLVSLEIRADGGQCSTPPAVSVAVTAYLGMESDGGGR